MNSGLPSLSDFQKSLLKRVIFCWYAACFSLPT